jgi:Ca-activated chloride channel homolog
MFPGTERYPFAIARCLAVAILAAAFCGAVSAQNAPSGQTQQQTQVPVEENPMDLPPRTPHVNPAPEPPPQQPGAQQSSEPSIQPLKDSGSEDNGRFVFKKNVQEVVLHATVVDDAGRLVTSLGKDAFTVFQNDQPEMITSFRREDIPVALGVVVDNSGSMRDKRSKVNQAVVNLIQVSNPQDQVFVVNFSQTPYLDQDFTSNVNLLQTALHQVSSRGSTALYDAVVASDVHLKNNPRLDRKVLLVITDGEDNMSRETLQDAIHKLQSSKGPTVYAIGLAEESMTRSAREALQKLASSTGGVAFFPRTLDEVNDITREIAHDIRSQYTLAYNPGPRIGTGYQRIRVEAKGRPHQHLTVRTRTGYYPGEALR